MIKHKYEWYKKMLNSETREIMNINTNRIEEIWSIVKNSLKNKYKQFFEKFF